MKVLLGVLFVMSIAVAGSDGPYFPYINYVGVGGLICFVILAEKHFPEKEDAATVLEEDTIEKLAELFEIGWEMSNQIRFERESTYWCLDSIAEQTRALNQVSIDMAELEGKFN